METCWTWYTNAIIEEVCEEVKQLISIQSYFFANK